MFLSWWRSLVQVAYPKTGKSKSKRWRLPRKLRYGPIMEQLEERVVPANTNLFLNEALSGAAVSAITAARSTTVPVYVDCGTLGGTGGISAATIYLKYDPTILSISSTTADIKLGSLLTPFGSAIYNTVPISGLASGVVGVAISPTSGNGLYSGTTGGHIAEFDFHVLQTINIGTSTLVDLLRTKPATSIQTSINDAGNAQYALSPTLSNYSGPLSQIGALAPTGFTPPDNDVADVEIQVIAVPPATTPTAVNDTFSMAPNTSAFSPTLNVTTLSTGVLGNDTDTGRLMNAVLTGAGITVDSATVGGVYTVTYTQTTPAGGTITLNAVNGTFTYTPPADFIGLDTFTYQAVDALSNTASATATVTIQVGGMLSIPQNLTIPTTAGSTVTVPINIASPNPANSGGLVTIGITVGYDATKFTVSAPDVTPGAVLSAAGVDPAWVNGFGVSFGAGTVNILTNGLKITNTAGGSVANIKLHLITGAGNSNSVVNLQASGTQLIVDGGGLSPVLPFAVAPQDNATGTPTQTDGYVTIGTGAPAGVATTTTVSSSNATPTYGTAVTLTAVVHPASGSTAPTAGSVQFFINGTTSLGTSSTGTANGSDAVFTYLTTASQLQVAAGAAQPLLATFSDGTSFTGSSSTNTATETVSPKTITASIIGNPTKVLDGTTAATLTSANYSLTGLVGGDSFTVNQTSGTYNSANVTATTVTASLAPANFIPGAGTVAGNYTLPTTASGPGTITSAPSVATTTTVSTSNATPTYGTAVTITALVHPASGSTAPIAGSVQFFINGTTSLGTSSTGTASGSDAVFTYVTTASQLQVAAGAAQPLSATFSDGASFTGSSSTNTATETVSPKTITASIIGNPTKVLDGTTAATLTSANYSLTGLVGGDSFTVNQTSGTYNSANVTATTVTASLAPANFIPGAGTVAGNYTLPTTASGPGTITSAATSALSLNVGGTASVAAARSTTIPVFVDVNTLVGNGGVSAANFYLKYDPSVLFINPATDIKLGSLLTGIFTINSIGSLAGNQVGATIQPVSGGTVYTGTAGGHLAEFDFHVSQSINVGATTLIDLLKNINAKNTNLVDQSGSNYALTPALTNYAGSSTQTGALTPGTFTPADADAADVAVQIVAQAPGVTPTAAADKYNMAPNSLPFTDTLTVTGLAQGVLANDTDGGRIMNAVLTGSGITTDTSVIGGVATVTYTRTTANGGTVTLNAIDGSFTYTPAPGFFGTDQFTYTAVDALTNSASAAATVTINVGGMISIPQNLIVPNAAGSTVSVPVNIATPNPANSGGLVTFSIGINYDSSKFTVSAADVTPGSVLTAAGVDPTWVNGFGASASAPGRIDILANGPAITNAAGGSLATITFHLLAPTTDGTTRVVNLAATGTQLIVNGPLGTSPVLPFATPPADNATNTPGALDGVITITGTPVGTPTTTTVSTSSATPTYGSAQTLTALVAPNSGTTTPTAGSVAFFINASTLLGLGTFAGTDASHDAIFKYITTPGQLQVNGGAAQPLSATYTPGAGFIGSISSNAATETVSPKALTVSVIGTPTKVYDGTTAATLVTANYSISGLVGTESFTINQNDGTYNSKDVATANSVTVSLTASNFVPASGTTAGNYAFPASATGAGAITAKTLTASIIGNPTKPYDGTTAATLTNANFSLGGLAGTDSFTVTQAAGTYDSKDVATASTVTASLAAGDFSAGAGTLSGNYTLPTTASGAGHVSAKAVTAAIIGSPTKTYNGNTAASLTSANFSLSGLVGSDSFTVSQTAGTFNTKDVATATTVSATLTAAQFTAGAGTTASNYSLPTNASGAGAITPKTLTASIVNNPTKSYDGTTAATLASSNFSLSGLVGTESFTVTQTAGTYASASAATSVGVTATLLAANFTAGSGTLATNYTLPTSASGTGKINPKALTVAIIGAPTKVYDGTTTAPALTDSNYSVNGLIGTDSFTVSQPAGNYNSKDVTATTISASLTAANFTAGAGTTVANYSLPTTASGPGTITPKTLTASIATTIKKYDGTTTAIIPSGNYSLTGLIGSESFTVQGNGTFNSKDVLTATTVNSTLNAASFTANTGTLAADYILPTTASGPGQIQPKTLAATLVNVTKPYDGTTNAILTPANFSLTLAPGESITVTQTVGTFASKDAATGIAVSASLSPGDFTPGATTLLSNYTALPTSASGLGNITGATLVINILNNPTKVYNGNTSIALTPTNFSGIVSGLIGTDSFTFTTSTTGNFNTKDVATATTVSAAMTPANFTAAAGTIASNYNLTFNATGPGTITPATVTVTASIIGNPTKQYDGTANATLTSANYSITGLIGSDSFTINQTAGTYDGVNAGSANTVTATLSAANFVPGANSSTSDYALPTSASGPGHIIVKVLTASIIGPPTKPYDGTTAATLTSANFNLAGVASGESITVAQPVGTYNSAHTTATTVSATLAPANFTAGAGTLLTNYTLPTTASGPGTITKATVTVGVSIVGNPTKAYDGATSATLTASNYSITGLIGTDTFSISQTVGSYNSKNVTATTVTAALTPASYTSVAGSQAADYTLPTSASGAGTITPKALTVAIVGNPTKPYDGTTNATLSSPNFGITGLASGESFTVTQTAGTYNSAHPGAATTVSTTLTDANFVPGTATSAANYTYPTSASGPGTIIPKTITVSIIGNPTKTYDGTTSISTLTSANYSVSGLLGSDSLTVSHPVGNFNTRNVTATTVSANLVPADFTAGAGTTAGDYNLTTTATGAGSITPLAITVTAKTNTKGFDGTTSAAALPTVTSGAIQPGDAAAFIETYDTSAVGANKTLTPSGVVNDGNSGNNYTYTFVNDTTGAINAATNLFLNVGASSVAAGRSATIPVFIDVGALAGSSGIQSANIYLKYDPSVLSFSAADIKLGSLLTGLYSINQITSGLSSGQLGLTIQPTGATVYTGTAGGHIAEVDFHVNQSMDVGVTTLIDVVKNFGAKSTNIADQNNVGYFLSPALTNYAGTSTQSGALTPATLTPADTDVADVTVKVVAQAPTTTPTAVADLYNMAPNASPFISTLTTTDVAGGVLGNDSDAGRPMNAVLSGSGITVGSATVGGVLTRTYTRTTAGGGTVTLNAVDGSFTYAPAPNFTGTDTFSYTAVDAISNAASSTTTVTIKVGGMLSIPQNATVPNAAGSTVTVPVNIGSPNPANSGGLVTISIGINYDPTKFTVSAADIAPGSVLTAAGVDPSWVSGFGANANTPGRIDILANGPAITNTAGGSVANITFHLIAPTVDGTTRVVNLAATGTQLVVNGPAGTSPVLPFAVAPADNATNTPGALDGVITISGAPVGTTTTTTVSTSNATPVYGTQVTITATVAPDAGTAVPTQGSVAFFINGTLLGVGSFASSDAAHDALFTYVTTPGQLQVNGGAAQPLSANYTAGTGFNSSTSTNTATETVSRKTLTAAIINTPTKPYDGTTVAFLTNANFGLTGLVGADEFTVNQSTGAYNNKDVTTANTVTTTLIAGNFVAASGTSAGNYNLPTTATGAGAISAKTLTASIIGNPTKPYDGTTTATLASANYSLSGLVGGESFTVSQTAGTYNSKDVATASIVTASLTAANFTAGSGTLATNYSLPTTASGAGHISAKALTANIVGPPTKIYDGTVAATLTSANFSLSGLASGESFTVTQTAGTYNSKDVATATTVTATLTAAQFTAGASTSASNYTLPTTATGAGAITPKALTASIVNNPTKAYDGTTAATLTSTNFSLAGLVGTESFTVTQTAGTYASKDAAASVGVTAALSAANFTAGSGTLASNYSLPTTASGTGKINAKSITVAIINNPTKVYDGTTTAPTLTGANYNVLGLIGTESFTVNQPAGTYNSKDVTATTISASLAAANFTAGAGTLASNYNLTVTATGPGTITPKALTASILPVVKKYDGTTAASIPPSSYVLTGLIGSESFTVTGGGTFNTRDVTTATTVSAVLAPASFTANTGTLTADYILPTSATGPGSIQPKNLTATLVNVTKAYDGTTNVTLTPANFSLNLGANDSIAVTQTVGTFASKDAATGIAVTANLAPANFTAGTGTLFSNYILPTSASGTGNITGATLVVNILGNPTKVYNGTTSIPLTAANFSGIISGFIGTDSFTFTKPATATGTFNSKDVATATTVSAPLTAANFTPVGTTNPANYNLSFNATGPGTVTPATLTGSITGNPTKVYDGTTAATLASTNYSLSGLVGTETLTVTQTAGTYNSAHVGAATTVTASLTPATFTAGTGTLLTNYNLTFSVSGPGAITAKALTAAIVGTPTKQYNGTNVATLTPANFSLTGLGGSDSFTVTQTAGIYNGINAGSATTVTASLAAANFSPAAGTLVTDYTFPTSATGAGSITAKAVTAAIIGNPTKTYDGNTSASLTSASYSLSGLVGSDSFTVNQTAGTYNSKDTTATTVTASLSAANFAAGSGTIAANYALPTTASGAGTITAKALTAAIIGNPTKAYDGTTAAALTSANYSLTGLVGTESLTVTKTAGTYNSKDVLTAATVSAVLAAADFAPGAGTLAADYLLPTSASGAGHITAKAITAAIIGNPTKIYDGNTNAALTSANFSLSGLASGESFAVNQTAGTYNSKDVTTAASVSASLTAANFAAGAGTSANNYSLPTSASGPGHITAKALTVNGVTASDKVYNATTAATLNVAGATPVGVISGDAVTLNTAGATGTFNTKDVGQNKPVAVSGITLGGAQATDYSVTQPTASANITPANLTVNGVTADNKPFDGTTDATIHTTGASLVGVFSGDIVSIDATNATGTFASVGPGNNIPVTVSGLALAGAQASDYTVTQPTTTANITSIGIALTVTGITASNKVYDASKSATLNLTGAILVGILPGDVVALNTSNAVGTFATKNVGTGIIVSITGLTLTGSDASKYHLIQPKTTANITAAGLTAAGITVNNKVYDSTATATLDTSSAHLVGAIYAGDSVTLVTAGATATFASVDVANNIPVSVSGITLGGAQAGNYSLTLPAFTANITQATLTVTGITAKDKVYNRTTAATINTGAATLVGVFPGDSVALVTSGATGTFAQRDVGTNIQVTISGLFLIGDQAGDYMLVQPTASANITPASLTVMGITAANKVYNASTLANLNTALASLVGKIGGDSVTLNTGAAVGNFATKDVGNNIPVTITGLTLSGAQKDDYVITPPVVSANITPASLSVTGITANNKPYDGTQAATLNTGTAALTGVFSGDSVGLDTSSATGTFATKNVGTNIAVTVNGLALTGAQKNDYVIAPTTAFANITPIAAVVSGITAKDKVYDHTTAATIDATGATLTGIIPGDSVTLTVTSTPTGAFTSKDVGTNIPVAITGGFTLTGAQKDNYVLTTSLNTKANITPKSISVTGIVAMNKVYDANTTATLDTSAATLSGTFAGDAVSLSGTATGQFASPNVANNITVSVSGLSLTGAQAFDYVLTPPASLKANITPKALTITGVTANSRVYNHTTVATLNTASAALVGVIPGDTVTLNKANALGTFTSKDVGTNIPVTVTGFALAVGGQSGNYTITQPTTSANITPATVTAQGITVNNKPYDGTTVATLNTGSATLSGVYSGDAVFIDASTATGAFASKAVGNNIQVTISGLSLFGAQKDDYVIAPLTKTANITPALTIVSPQSVLLGSTLTINNTMLLADPSSAANTVVYQLTSVPSSGSFKKGATTLTVGSTFTQADINNGLITFTGATKGSFFFSFVVTDGQGGTVPNTTFNISVV